MARPAGARNADFDVKKRELVSKARARLLTSDGAFASFRDLAAACDVATPTLRHYFGDREGVIAAVLEALSAEGAQYLLAVAKPPTQPLRDSLAVLLAMVLRGMRGGLDHIHSLGLTAGLRHRRLGPAYLDQVLEPTLQAFEAHLAHHAAAGALRPDVDLRLATLALLAPVLVAALHQSDLGGSRCRPLDLDAMLAPHLEAWLRAWAAPRALHPSRTRHRG